MSEGTTTQSEAGLDEEHRGFSDGTGQDGGARPEQRISKIYKLYRISRDHADTAIDPGQQVVFYDAGSGTDRCNRAHRARALRTRAARLPFNPATMATARRFGEHVLEGSALASSTCRPPATDERRLDHSYPCDRTGGPAPPCSGKDLPKDARFASFALRATSAEELASAALRGSSLLPESAPGRKDASRRHSEACRSVRSVAARSAHVAL